MDVPATEAMAPHAMAPDAVTTDAMASDAVTIGAIVPARYDCYRQAKNLTPAARFYASDVAGIRQTGRMLLSDEIH